MSDTIVIYSDGASRGNPGPASIGAVLYDGEGQVLEEISEALGIQTNNVAEYQALIAGLEAAAARSPQRLIVRSDSQLLVRQIEGRYRVKAPGLKPLFRRVSELLEQFPRVEIEHVRRELNTVADALANEALDA